MAALPTVVFLLFALLLAPARVSIAVRPLHKLDSSPYSVLINPHRQKEERVFHEREAEGCMPKSVRVPPSAPSRYGNYYTLGDVLCKPEGRHKP
ncbi:hypothetical protein KSP39_PZI004844 [Platanthera zijinensis]|uniref:Uncharacterized protein n=1 Tax=Platanthera zijinensis TaxID=2320716 RepID=A0AAP0BV54_9ASPA